MAQEMKLSREKKAVGQPRLTNKEMQSEKVSQEKQEHLDNALFIAAEDGNFGNAFWLIRGGANVNAWHRICQSTPLIEAASKGKLDICLLLIENGAYVNARDGSLYSALHRAALEGDTSLCALLLWKGADIEAMSGGSIRPGSTALDFAKSKGKKETATFLITSWLFKDMNTFRPFYSSFRECASQ
jgi:hypothetical protein